MSASLINKLFNGAQETRERDIYVFSADIDGLDDMRDPDLLWDQRRILRATRGQACLKQTLDAMRYRHAGKLVAPASVELEISAETVERDRRFGGQLVDDMLRVFTRKHAECFGDALPDGLQPRYTVRPSYDVQAGQMRIRTGPAIHVPQADERIVWKVQTCLDGVMWDAAPPVLLTERQRLSIIAGALNNASYLCSHWPFDPQDGLVLLNLPGESRLDISSEPLGHLSVGWNDAVDCYVVRSPDPALSDACLYLRATRLVPVTLPDLPSRHDDHSAREAGYRPPAAAPAMGASPIRVVPPASAAPQQPKLTAQPGVSASARHQAGARLEPVLMPVVPPASTVVPVAALPVATTAPDLPADSPEDSPRDAAAPDDQGTLLAERPRPMPLQFAADDEFTLLASVPVPQASLVLEGLALQRPSQFASAGVRGLQWGVDAAGGVVAPNAAGALVRFTVDAHDHLHVATAGGSRELRQGEAVPLKGSDLVLRVQPLPQPLPALYAGWMPLPLGAPARLAQGRRLAVGRNLECLRPLQPLAGPGFLPDAPRASGDRMGLSRQHFELEASDQGLLVRPLGANTVAHLDAHMQFVATATADHPALLNDGDCLVVGHYVWRFSA